MLALLKDGESVFSSREAGYLSIPLLYLDHAYVELLQSVEHLYTYTFYTYVYLRLVEALAIRCRDRAIVCSYQ